MGKSYGIKVKVFGLSFIGILGVVVLMAISQFAISQLSQRVIGVTEERMPKALLIVKLRLHENAMMRYLFEAAAQKPNSDDRKKRIEKVGEKIGLFDADLERFFKFKHSDETMGIMGPVREFWATARKEAQVIVEKLEAGGSESDIQKLIFDKVSPVVKQISEATGAQSKVSDQHTEHYVEESKTEGARIRVLSGGLSLVVLVLLVIVGYLVSTQISSSITGLVSRVDEGSGHVANASNSLSSTSSQLAASGTEQAASLQKTAGAIEEISAMVTLNAESARSTSELAQTSLDSVVKGKGTVEEMADAIQQISVSTSEILNQIQASNTEVSQVIGLIQEIGNKTKVINDIVFQTRILSFNASVEAARAGEQGKGFAVVAEEVGKLAQMSGTAAKEITDMLDSSIHKVEATLSMMKSKIDILATTGRDKVDQGERVSKECELVLTEIGVSVQKMAEKVQEIATASKEQALGVQEVSSAIGQLDQVTRENQAASEEAATIAADLTRQSSLLSETVSELVHVVSGS